MTSVVPLSAPTFGGNEQRYLMECVETTMVSTVGLFVERFERELAAEVGAVGAVACGSGTAALQLALLAVGVGPGSEVWIPDSTFVATANAAVHCGATPVLLAVDEERGYLAPEVVVDELHRRSQQGLPMPGAIVVVHLYGHPADLSWLRYAVEFGVPVIEDAAEALGASWRTGVHGDRSVGVVGTLGCFSFNGNKVITAGNGGMVVGENPAVLARIRHLSTQARIPGSDYEHDAVGFNHRLSNLCAALGVAQLEQLAHFVSERRRINRCYVELLAGTEGVRVVREAPWARSSAWLSCVVFSEATSRDRARAMLRDGGIEARPWWTPMHMQLPYRAAERLGPMRPGLDLYRLGLSLPSTPGTEDATLERIASLVGQAVRG